MNRVSKAAVVLATVTLVGVGTLTPAQASTTTATAASSATVQGKHALPTATKMTRRYQLKVGNAKSFGYIVFTNRSVLVSGKVTGPTGTPVTFASYGQRNAQGKVITGLTRSVRTADKGSRGFNAVLLQNRVGGAKSVRVTLRSRYDAATSVCNK